MSTSPATATIRWTWHPAVINQKAYEYALADKLQENNLFAKGVNQLHQWLEANNSATERSSVEATLLSTLIKIVVAKGVVKTLLNYLKQTLFSGSSVSLPST